MTLFSQTLLLYVLIGVGVAAALYLSDDGRPGDRWLPALCALAFWPIFLPYLLRRRGQPNNEEPRETDKDDEMSAAIRQVDIELDRALRSLDGWAEDVLARERERIEDLRSAWRAQAERIREMDRVLAWESESVKEWESEKRRSNIERLRKVRERHYRDLMGTLAWVRELVSMIHLAKFTGAPASRAEELVAQIAAAVEGLSELAWEEPANTPPQTVLAHHA